jgi:RNA polymerase sigma factor (TIGR02999 family)
VYGQLHEIARALHGERSGHTLQTTALVNEAYLRLVDCGKVNGQDWAHFFAISAQLMRRILIDFARSRDYLKGGGAVAHISLDEAPSVCNEPDLNLVALDDALKALSAIDERKSKAVGAEVLRRIECRRNGGSIGYFERHRNSGLAIGQNLAFARVESRKGEP